MNLACVCVIGAMKLEKIIIILVANLRCFVVIAGKTEHLDGDDLGVESYRYLNEKKVHFSKSTAAQYIKFGVNLPSLLDFAMCLWYKPITFLDHNVLFSYGNQKEQLILWKIKKKQNTPVVIFKLFNTLIMEEKIPKLLAGEWHHLCQYWQGSSGLWASFMNTYIVSFGYSNTTATNRSIPAGTFNATINHPRTKDTLHGEIYGFYLTSLNTTSLPFSPFASKTIRKRQTETFPVDAEPRALFFVGKLFTFVRRMVAIVTIPIFRFARGLISPWRRSLFAPRSATPTTKKPPVPPASFTKLPPSSATEIITNLKVETTTTKKAVIIHTSILSKANETHKLEKSAYSLSKVPLHSDFTNLEDSMTIYETEPDTESRYMRNILTMNQTTKAKPKPKPSSQQIDSVEGLNIQPQESNNLQTYFNDVIDKCLMLELTFRKLQIQKQRLDHLDSAEVATDPITRLDTSLQFMQFLYACCYFQNEAILISWDRSKVFTNNVLVQNISGCSNF